MDYKCKKGDVIAIGITHSCHSIGMARTEWRDLALGRAHKVNRKGIVEQFTIGNQTIFHAIDRSVMIATISDADKRAAAEKLLAERGADPFETAEDLKSAILAA